MQDVAERLLEYRPATQSKQLDLAYSLLYVPGSHESGALEPVGE